MTYPLRNRMAKQYPNHILYNVNTSEDEPETYYEAMISIKKKMKASYVFRSKIIK